MSGQRAPGRDDTGDWAGSGYPFPGTTADLDGEAPPAPGQVAYEAAVRVMLGDDPGAAGDGPDFAWNAIGSVERDSWDAAAKAVLEQCGPALLRETAADNIRLREGVAVEAARLEASAAKTAPSKKSQIETGCAKALRELLEGS